MHKAVLDSCEDILKNVKLGLFIPLEKLRTKIAEMSRHLLKAKTI